MKRLILAVALLCLFVTDSQAQFRGPSDLDSLEASRPTYIELQGNVAWGPNTTFLFEGGVGVLTRIDPNIRIGVTDLNYASADQLAGNRHSITFAPAVEYFVYTSRAVALSGRLAVPLQIRWGAELDSKLGVQPYLQAAIDFFPSELLSLGVYARSGFVVTEGFIRSPRVLPQSTIALTGGLNIKFHF
jgi:hypothetical protein